MGDQQCWHHESAKYRATVPRIVGTPSLYLIKLTNLALPRYAEPGWNEFLGESGAKGWPAQAAVIPTLEAIVESQK